MDDCCLSSFLVSEICSIRTPRSSATLPPDDLIISNLDNSMVTIACDTLPKAGFLEPKCAFGISMLYIVRPNTFIGEGVDFGGELPQDKIATLAVRIQEVLKTKTGAGADTLTTAYAEARFALAMAHAMNGKKNNVLEKNLGLPKVNAYGQELLKKDISELKKNIRKGEEFVKNYVNEKKVNFDHVEKVVTVVTNH
ncbi:conserved hypothetical protein [Culex quinquefasciatus]|uniref:Malate dehydrogenase n=1 Tax=Culex quinquefasciatus TaxID=7176 RepID=B0W9Q2_CULQU|nr:conserved hypothetical protein [Culex quinquefasciatus]|eukprot:XP_001845436.1 conserved hypothetical protein [Culex quinquefasciatus]